jgi:hypothetical protein
MKHKNFTRHVNSQLADLVSLSAWLGRGFFNNLDQIVNTHYYFEDLEIMCLRNKSLKKSQFSLLALKSVLGNSKTEG